MRRLDCCVTSLTLECRLATMFLLLFVSTNGYGGAGGIRDHDETGCENHRMELLCPGTDVINVQMVTYGRQDDRICIVDKERMANTHCSLRNALEIVSSRCNGKTSCSFEVGDATLPDPCPGTSKYLHAIWECISSSALSAITCPGRLHSVTHGHTHLTSLERNAAWLRDPFQHTKKIYYMAWSRYDSSTLYEFSSTQSLKENHPITFHHLPDRVDGTGFVIYDGSVYYNKERSRKIVKYDLGKGQTTVEKELPNANYHGTSPYAIDMATDIDLAVDEKGLWVIYATEANDGNIVISRLQRRTLNVLNTWQTSYEKLSALNAFITCGVLYVVNYESLKIDYMFNTTSNTEKQLQISIPDLSKETSAIEYNPKDQMLYIWAESSASTYKLKFKQIIPPTTTTTTTTMQTTTRAPPVTRTTTIKRPNPVGPVTPSSKPERPDLPPSPIATCLEVEASGLSWPNTSVSKVAYLDCPGGSPGHAIWACGGNASNPKWTTPNPDLSQCSSMWLKDLEQQIDVGRISVVDLSEKLVALLHEKRRDITSWDIVTIIELLKRFLQESANDINSASSITDAVLKTASELLHPEMSYLWNSLGNTMQTKASISLSNLLEEAAFFLAKDMIQNSGADDTSQSGSSASNRVTWSESYATLAIRIEPVAKPVTKHGAVTTARTSTVVTLNSGHGDSVTIDDQSLVSALKAVEGENIAVVHLSFKNLGSHIIDSDQFGSVKYPVNSQVIALSVKSMNRDGAWSPQSSRLELSRPVTLHMKHNSQYFTHHVCAFWDEVERSPNKGSWWRSGCRRVGGNSTHSTCQCDHLTNFVVLSSQDPFPPMGVVENETMDTSSDYLRFANVVRGGMILSIIFLVVVMIILVKHSRSLDLNTIHKNLVASLLALELVFVIGIDQVTFSTVCLSVAAILHYGVLCVFTWAALEAYHHLVALNDIRERNNRWKVYYLLGYGLPLLVVGICLAVNVQGYANDDMCWVDSGSSYIWAFIAPCCIAICLCVGLVAFVLYKLGKDRTSLTDSNGLHNTRSDIASTCILMFLLCTKWSCGFLWLSGYNHQLTAWLFAIFLSAHGIAIFLLYCVLPERVNVWPRCLKKTESHFPRSSASGLRLVNNSSVRASTRGDGTTVHSGYHYGAGRSGTATTLIPATGNHRRSATKAATMRDGSEVLPLVAQCDASATLSHDLVTSHWVRKPNSEMGRSSFNSIDDTDPKLPTMRHPHLSSTATWNEYAHTSSRPSVGSACSKATSSQCPVHGCNMGTPCGHAQQYEEPNSGGYSARTTSTAYSCCYDHLHEEQLKRSGISSNHHPSCNKCNPSFSHAPHPSSQRRVPLHHYETLGPFEEDGELSRGSFSCETCSTNPRHRYEDVASDAACPELQEQQMTSLHNQPHHSHQATNSITSRRPETSICHNKSYGYCGCGQAKHASCIPGHSKGEVVYSSTRNGRSSDPLSTDQGYDTDSQQVTQLLPRNSNSDNEGVQSTSRSGQSQANTSTQQSHQLANGGEVINQRSSSLSAGSDCCSENDREVEFINSASSSAAPSVVNTFTEPGHLKQRPSASPVACGPHDNDGTLTAIDTVKGGNIGAAGSVNSWSAVMGSNPRSSFPAYGLNQNRKSKSTVDPQVILSQARQRQEVRNSIGSMGSASTENRSSENLPSSSYSGYTLPGTAETGTKARIDLRAGGVNMITNL